MGGTTSRRSSRSRSGKRPADAILDSISDGVFTVDRSWRITTFNRAAEAITKTPRAEAIGAVIAAAGRPARAALAHAAALRSGTLKQLEPGMACSHHGQGRR